MKTTEAVASGQWRVASVQRSPFLRWPFGQGAGREDGANDEVGMLNDERPHLHSPLSPRPSSLVPRRGVLLLLILALLSMFGLIAVTFVLITGQAKRSAKSVERMERMMDPPPKLLQQAAMQVFRGSTNPASVMGAHSLLEDMYGTDVITGRVLNNPSGSDPTTGTMNSCPLLIDPSDKFSWVNGGQIIWITINSPSLTTIAQKMRCVGRVLTMTTGPAKGKSTRILGYDQTNDRFYLQAFEGQSIRAWDSGTPGYVFVDGSALSDGPGGYSEYVINGTPFSGTGFGYNPGNGKLNVYYDLNPAAAVKWIDPEAGTPPTTSFPSALLPNLPLSAYYSNPATLFTNPQSNPPGGANEDYDAADFQNMLLAAQVYNNAKGRVDTLPSFHRPALVNYWYHQLYGTIDWVAAGISTPEEQWKFLLQPYGADHKSPPSADPLLTIANTIVALKRKIMMRPLSEDHPDFNGSNPYSYVLQTDVYNEGANSVRPYWERGDYGQWDVDNDGDGTPDSVWVDLGMPVRTMADGRKYKPLFAILCTDLDGRLNLNAHGNVTQAITGTTPDPVLATTDSLLSAGFTLAGNPLPMDFTWTQRGLGFGPAEINLSPVLSDATGAALPLVYQNFLGVHWEDNVAPFDSPRGNRFLSNGLDGRYAQLSLLDPLTPHTTFPNPGAGYSYPTPGNAGLDVLNYNKWFEYYGDNQVASAAWPDYWWRFLNLPASDYKRDSYGSPPDPMGQGAIGLDVAGRPLYMNGMGGSVADSPYEANLSPNTARGLPSNTTTDNAENPFSLAELERILRPYDRDATALPARLAILTSTTTDVPQDSVLLLKQRRLKVTTESWDLPCPNLITPSSMSLAERALLPNNRVTHITDLLRARGIPESAWSQLLPPEMLAGLKMDINRPFGNGRSDDAAASLTPGIVDAPEVPTTTKQIELADSTGSTTPVPASYDGICFPDPATKKIPVGSGGMAANPLEARQLEARYLYVLMFLLADRAYLRNEYGSAENAARAVAQWAVNVVDFRDRDNIMTPFDYDPNFAFDDGTPQHAITQWKPTNLPDNRVWGCERPELLITETLAFHDRRSQDLSDDGGTVGGTPADAHGNFDQALRPQGSLFVELYNPAGPLDAPAGLSTTGQAESLLNGGSYVSCVRLNQTAATATTPTGGAPVWRLVITNGGADATKDLDDPDATQKPTIERSIYFTDLPALTGLTGKLHGRKFYTSSTTNIAPLLPGRYAVIGPDTQTLVGTRSGGTASETRQIDLNENSDPNVPTSFQVQVQRNRDTTSSDNEIRKLDSSSPSTIHIKPPIAVVVDRCVDDSGAGVARRLSVSEPQNDYDYGASSCDTSGNISPVLPSPLDVDPELAKIGTTLNYKVVHLQRLANPRKPYSPLIVKGNGEMKYPADYNPYITIDSQPIDLTVFNGFDASEYATKTVCFASHQRGEANNNLWEINIPSSVTPPGASTGNGSDPHHFNYELRHTLGYLNEQFVDVASPFPREGANPATKAFSYRGDPPDTTGPFPWLTWNNRPYISPLELLYVPAVQSSQLLRKYNLAQGGSSPYRTDISTENHPFPYLLSFFQSNELNLTTGDSSGAQFHRILEYLRVPSPFACTETQIKPDAASMPTAHAFRPPFNQISTYREPGRININTIYDREVFNGLRNYFPYPDYPSTGDDIWPRLVWSRRGYSNVGAQDAVLAIDSTCPTEFARPFRSFAGAALRQPLPTLETYEDNASNQLIAREINGTLLRMDPYDMDQNNPPSRPLFLYDNLNDGDLTNDAVVNTDRNPFFRYQGLERLGNLVTTRSNVYAVWVTVGYFEVAPAPSVDLTRWPDGYQLGRELGIDTGEVERHRAFYIFDRTLPVGFRRGEDLNVEKAILLNRYIE